MTTSDRQTLRQSGTHRIDAVQDARLSERYFRTFIVSRGDSLLSEIYRLRYQVICEERDLLPTSLFPDRMESDECDRDALHLATINCKGQLVACARLISREFDKLPVAFWCSINEQKRQTLAPLRSIAEVSRVILAPVVRSRVADGYTGDCAVASQNGTTARGLNHVALSLYRGIYQAARYLSISHLVCMLEESCHLALYSHRIPFRTIGAVSDYIGTTTPYVLALDELGKTLQAQHPLLWERFQTMIAAPEYV